MSVSSKTDSNRYKKKKRLYDVTMLWLRCSRQGYNNNHVVKEQSWSSWLKKQNNIDCRLETGNEQLPPGLKSDVLLTHPSTPASPLC